MKQKRGSGVLALGLMSGTSADGVSLALVEIRGMGLKVLRHETRSYPADVRKRILASADMKARELSRLDFELGSIFASAARSFCLKNRVPFKKLAAAGSHGQTVCHCPDGNPPSTLQIGEPSFIAETLGVPVVADFRPSDMAAGGQGAPLIPFLDEYLFGSGPARMLQNIGGIGNLSVVGGGVEASGFDTGPGNCLMDAAVRAATGGKLFFDKDGRFARSGRIDFGKVERLLRLPFFSRKPPKSLDRDDFGPGFLLKHWGGVKPSGLADAVATLNYFTAASIELAARKFVKAGAAEMTVSGGGALNPVLMEHLARLLKPVKVSRISEYGIHPLAKEPACFALMAWLALGGKSNHCPGATGARGKRILGKIIMPGP